MPEPTMLDAPIAATSAAVDRDANIGADKARALFALMPSVDQRLRQAAAGTADVMVRGEPGLGKELFARALHAHSPRAQAPFVRVVCGTSTNADVDPSAWLTEAGNGSLFLDEIAELSASAQYALLRALRTFDGEARDAARRRGPRLMCSSAQALEAMVARGEFRADLYYRVHVVAIQLPALRTLAAREIEALAGFFLARHNAATGRRVRFSAQALRRMERCRWPGNLRELENCVENAATLACDELISIATLPCTHCLARVLGDAGCRSGVVCGNETSPDLPLVETEADARRQRIVAALQHCGWVQAKAARMLGLTPRQIGYAIRQLEIDVLKL